MAATPEPDDLERKEVLARFLAEHPKPRAEDVRRWSKRHPKFANEILAFAIDLNRIADLQSGHPASEPTPEELDAAWERHQALAQSIEASAAERPRLAEIAANADTDLADLADKIDIDRRILIGLESGRVLLPVSRRLVEAIAAALRTGLDDVAAALQASYLKPKVAFAKSFGTPTTARRRYADVVQASGMSEERKAFWIGED